MIPLALGNIVVTAIFVLAGQERLMYWIGFATLGAIFFYLSRKPAPARPAASHKVAHAS